MDRREAIKRAALLSGYALSASTISAVMQGCKADSAGDLSGDWTPSYLTEDEAVLVAEIGETILPHTDDSPGAKDVNVHQFIDLMLADYVDPEDQENYRQGLQQFSEACREANGGKDFVALTPEERLTYLTTVNQEAISGERSENGPAAEYLPFFITLKQAVFTGYFTSEAVGTEVLAYDPIPGEYQSCAPLEEVSAGRVWAL